MRLAPAFAMLVLLGCSPSGNDTKEIPAKRLFYTDPAAGGYRLIQDSGIGSSDGIVLALVGPGGPVRGLVFTYQFDPGLGARIVPLQLNNALRTFDGGGQYGIFAFQGTSFDTKNPVVAFSLMPPKSGNFQQPTLSKLVVVDADGKKSSFQVAVGNLELR